MKYYAYMFKSAVPVWSEEKKDGVFSGQSVVLTGTLTDFKRSEAQKLIEERGGVCQSSVTAKTTLVLAGEEAGSKLAKAQKLGIKIISRSTVAADYRQTFLSFLFWIDCIC